MQFTDIFRPRLVGSLMALAAWTGFACVTASAQAGAEDFDYDLFADVLVDDPASAGDAPYHLLKIARDASIPLQVAGGIGLTWVDGDAAAMANLKLHRSRRLQLGGRINADPANGDISDAVIGLRHQIHRYLAWGIKATARERAGADGSDAGGSFVFMARKRRWLGTLLGLKGKLGAGFGDAVSVGGIGLRSTVEFDWDARRDLTVLAGFKTRSATDDFGALGVDGWLATEVTAPRAAVLRLSLGFGVGGGTRQRDPSAALFLLLEPPG